jgi:hypothetical protein
VCVAVLVKVLPVVLLPWFVWRADEGRGRLVAWATALLTVGGLVTGPGLWWDFICHGLPVVAQWVLNRAFNFSLPALVGNLGLAFGVAAAETVVPPVALGVWAGGYALCWRGQRTRELEFSLLSVAMVLGSPTAWGYYYVLLLFPAAVGAVALCQNGSRRHRLWFVLAVLLMNVMQRPQGLGSNEIVVVKMVLNYLPLYGALIFGAVVASWPGGSRPEVGRD